MSAGHKPRDRRLPPNEPRPSGSGLLAPLIRARRPRPHGRGWLAGGVLALLLAGGCARPAGVIFPAMADAPRWPAPPATPRVQYVGQLATSGDLKARVPFGKALGQAVFGKPPAHSMLTPYAVCTDGGERLFVADSNAQVVHVFNFADRSYQPWRPGTPKQPGRFAQPVGLAWHAPAGRLLVADSVEGVVQVFDAGGRHLGPLGQDALKRPVALAVQPATGRIYVADAAAHQVVVLTTDGQEVVRIGKRGVAPGEFNFPTAVAFDGQGRLYVSDSLNFRVQQIEPDMKTVRVIGAKGDMPGYFAQPRGLAVDADDHLYVIDNQFEVVQVFDSQGRVLMDFGEEGRGPGQFWLPVGIHIDPRNRIWVADSYNRRVQVFDYAGEGKP